MSSLLRDLRHAVRSLRRSPGFTAVALLTLALGTGANVAIFSVVHGVLLEPLPFAEPDRLVTVWNHNPLQGYDKDVTSYPNFEDWRRQAGAFTAMVGVRGTDVTLSELGAAGSSPEEVRGAQVTEGYFALLGVEPALGRGFRADEHAAGGQVVVLSHRLSRDTLVKLRSQYAGDRIATLRNEQDRARSRGETTRVSELAAAIEDVEAFRQTIESIERGDSLIDRIRCRWKVEEATGRPGPYAPDIDDGVKVNIRPFQENGLLPAKVISKW